MLYPCVFSDEICLDAEQAARVCLEEGMPAMQLRQVYQRGRNVIDFSDEDLRHLAAALRRSGVHVQGIGSPCGKCGLDDAADSQRLQRFERVLRVADIFGTQLVRIFGFCGADGEAEPGDSEVFAQAMPRIVERLHWPVERARQEGIVLGLENEYTTLVGTCREVRQIVDTIDSPALRICWDVASGWYTGESILPDGYKQVRGRMCDVHVRDAFAQPGAPARHGEVCVLGDGAIDWHGILRRLYTDGYRGPCTLEPHLFLEDPDGGVRRRAATIQSIRALRRLVGAIDTDGSAWERQEAEGDARRNMQ